MGRNSISIFISMFAVIVIFTLFVTQRLTFFELMVLLHLIGIYETLIIIQNNLSKWDRELEDENRR